MNVVITGTSKGIGLEMVKQILPLSFRVLAVARNMKQTPLPDLVARASGKLELCEADLTEENALTKMTAALKDWKQIDLLVNNAGVLLGDETMDDFLRSFRINTVTPFFITKALKPWLQNSAQPKVINVSSLMGSISENHSGGSHSYRASKAALNMLVKGLAVEENWLTTIVVHPGWVRTNMGGKNAPLEPAESVRGILGVIQRVEKKDSGSFINYDGKKLPW